MYSTHVDCSLFYDYCCSFDTAFLHFPFFPLSLFFCVSIIFLPLGTFRYDDYHIIPVRFYTTRSCFPRTKTHTCTLVHRWLLHLVIYLFSDNSSRTYNTHHKVPVTTFLRTYKTRTISISFHLKKDNYPTFVCNLSWNFVLLCKNFYCIPFIISLFEQCRCSRYHNHCSPSYILLNFAIFHVCILGSVSIFMYVSFYFYYFYYKLFRVFVVSYLFYPAMSMKYRSPSSMTLSFGTFSSFCSSIYFPFLFPILF